MYLKQNWNKNNKALLVCAKSIHAFIDNNRTYFLLVLQFTYELQSNFFLLLL